MENEVEEKASDRWLASDEEATQIVLQWFRSVGLKEVSPGEWQSGILHLSYDAKHWCFDLTITVKGPLGISDRKNVGEARRLKGKTEPMERAYEVVYAIHDKLNEICPLFNMPFYP